MPENSNLAIQDCSLLEAELETVVETATQQINAERAEIEAAMQREIKAIEDDAPDVGGIDGTLGADFDVTFDTTEILIPWAEIRVDWKEAKLDLPQVKMVNQEIVFHTPSIRMVNKKTGQYPEFRCSGLKCTVKWSDIITKVPEPFMQEQRIVMGIPEFWVDTTSVQVPHITISFSQKSIKLDLPQFTLKNVYAETDEMAIRARSVSNRYQNKFSALTESSQSMVKSSVASKVHACFNCHKNNLIIQRDSQLKSIEATAMSVQTQIDLAKTQGATEQLGQMQETLQNILKQKADLEARFEAMIEQIEANEQRTINQIVDGVD